MMLQETMTILLKTQQGGEPEPVEIPRRVGNVLIGDLLGEGTGGAVFAGYDDALSRRVAVKVLHRRQGGMSDQALAELVSGVRSAASIKHPNIVTVYSVESRGPLAIIVMELIDGISLREVCKRVGRVELGLALYLLRSVLAGIEALHLNSVVHRDLKPANILISHAGDAHVCDFGLTCSLRSSGPAGDDAPIAGSPLYMAPETFAGDVSPQGDVYALGCILFELLTGHAPFNAPSLEELRALHETAELPLEKLTALGLQQGLLDAIARALHKQKIMRYKSATHLQRAVAPFTEPHRDSAYRARLSGIVSARPDEPTRGPREETLAATTFDLIARKAAAKRDRRES